MKPFADLLDDTDAQIRSDDINDYFDALDRPKWGADDKNTIALNGDIEDAVIILHGIRDNGHWTKRIARNLKSTSKRCVLRAPSPSYGFFSMFDFLMPNRRRRQALWFLEQYADVRECYPRAKISFVGHSNGTYLAGKAMEECNQVEFKRMVLAGSVLRTDFDRDGLKEKGQLLEAVLNLKGTRDNVVACLPGAMQKIGVLRFLNVGGGRFFGFNKATAQSVHEYGLAGRHVAGISEPAWETITDFITNKTVPTGNGDPASNRLKWLSWVAACIIVCLIIVLIAGFLYVLFNFTWTVLIVGVVLLVFRVLRHY